MDTCKIENFKSEYPDRDFPIYQSLDANRCKEVAIKIQKNLMISHEIWSIDFMRFFDSRQEIISKIEDDFSLEEILIDQGVNLLEEVYINWSRFDYIDVMATNVLSQNFFDIWYPSVDDIEIFDSSCTWFLSVRHDGVIKFFGKQA